MRRIWRLLALALLVPHPGWGVPAEDAKSGGTSTAGEAVTPADLPWYVPPAIGVPETTQGAAERGGPSAPPLSLLAPDHVARTTVEQPTLYWYLAQRSSAPVEITVRTSETTLLQEQIPPPVEAGLRAVRLGDRGVRLAPGVSYRWFVSIVSNAARPAKNPTVEAWILRQEPSRELRQRLAATPGREVFVYAENGIWYDAIASVSSAIEAKPSDPGPRAQRAALLEQVGLPEVAAFDRAQGAGP